MPQTPTYKRLEIVVLPAGASGFDYILNGRYLPSPPEARESLKPPAAFAAGAICTKLQTPAWAEQI